MSREEAIKIIRREYSCVDRDCDIERSCGKCPYSMPSKEPILKAYCLAVEALELVTSYEGTINKLTEALNQQKEGHWVGIDEEPNEVWECDHCGFVIDGSGCIDPYDYRDTYKYCPNCGAHMRGEEE